MAVDKIQKTIVGKRFGLSSSGDLVVNQYGTTGPYVALVRSTADVVQGSTLFDMAMLKSRSVLATVNSSVGSTMNAYGTNIISSGTATAVIMEIGRPTAGQRVEILSRTSASELTVKGTATTILFGAGTTAFLSAAGGVAGASIVLRGESTARFGVLSKSTDWAVA